MTWVMEYLSAHTKQWNIHTLNQGAKISKTQTLSLLHELQGFTFKSWTFPMTNHTNHAIFLFLSNSLVNQGSFPVLLRALGGEASFGFTMMKGLIQPFASNVRLLYYKRSYFVQTPAKWMELSFQLALATRRTLLLVLGSMNPMNVIVLLLN